MSNNQGPIPKGTTHFANQIVDKLRLVKASTISLIEKYIVEAIRDQQECEHARELVGCAGCGILLSRYSCVQERFGTRCPQCGAPMAARDVLQMKRIAELEEKVRKMENGRDGKISV